MTAAGREFERYALSIIRVWEEARQQVAIPEGFTRSLTIGAQYSLWPRLGFRWIDRLQTALPDLTNPGLTFSLGAMVAEQDGSVALRYTATSNDGDTSNDLGVGLRYGTFDGVNGLDFNASYAFGEENGTVTQNTLLAGVDYRRNLSDTFFAYGQLDTAIDRLAVNVALTDSLALRTSYATRYSDATDASFSDGANTLGVSVV